MGEAWIRKRADRIRFRDMGSDSDNGCHEAMKHRIIPRLTQTDNSDPDGTNQKIKKRTTKNDSNGKQETCEERIERISQTNVSFLEFWLQCLDWKMLRLFFFFVGVASLIYLFFVFNFNEKLWNNYFPSRA